MFNINARVNLVDERLFLLFADLFFDLWLLLSPEIKKIAQNQFKPRT